MVLDDAEGVRVSGVVLDTVPGRPAWALTNVRGLHARDATGLTDGDPPSVAGTRARPDPPPAGR